MAETSTYRGWALKRDKHGLWYIVGLGIGKKFPGLAEAKSWIDFSLGDKPL